MPSRKPLVDKKGIIDLETAKQRFHDYYNLRTKNKIGRLRAKMFDIKYQKKPRNVLRPGEPGSAKFLLEEGPRTFDMVGVDYFPEGERIDIDDPEYDNVSVISSGSTHKRDDTDDPDELEKIYGPRIKNNKRLYSKHFGDKFRGRREEGDLKDKKLIEIYWDKYRSNPERYRRKNKREKNQDEIDLVQFEVRGKIYFIDKKGTIYNDTGYEVDNLSFQDEFKDEKDLIITVLQELDIIDEVGDNIYDIDQNIFRILLTKQSLERGNNDETPSIKSRTPSLIESESESESQSTPFKRLKVSSSSNTKTKKSKQSSEEQSFEISLDEPSEVDESEVDESEVDKSEVDESEVDESEVEEEFEINPGLNEDKSTGKKYYLEVSEDGEELIIYNDNRRVKIGVIKIEEADYNKFKKLGINATKLVLLDEGSESEQSGNERSESEQSGGTYYSEIDIDEYELIELEKLAGLR